MTREQAINYLKSSGMSEKQIETVINALTCNDCIRELIREFDNKHPALFVDYVREFNHHPISEIIEYMWDMHDLIADIQDLPSVTPKFTDTEIQKMQELEQAQLEKAYELGRAEVQPYDDAISRAEALKHSHIEYDDDGIGHRVVYVEDIEELPSVNPVSNISIQITEREKYGRFN